MDGIKGRKRTKGETENTTKRTRKTIRKGKQITHKMRANSDIAEQSKSCAIIFTILTF